MEFTSGEFVASVFVSKPNPSGVEVFNNDGESPKSLTKGGINPGEFYQYSGSRKIKIHEILAFLGTATEYAYGDSQNDKFDRILKRKLDAKPLTKAKK